MFRNLLQTATYTLLRNWNPAESPAAQLTSGVVADDTLELWFSNLWLSPTFWMVVILFRHHREWVFSVDFFSKKKKEHSLQNKPESTWSTANGPYLAQPGRFRCVFDVFSAFYISLRPWFKKRHMLAHQKRKSWRHFKRIMVEPFTPGWKSTLLTIFGFIWMNRSLFGVVVWNVLLTFAWLFFW